MSNSVNKNSRFGMLAGDTSIKKVMKKSNSKNKLNEEKSINSDVNNSFKRSSNNQRYSQNKYSNENLEKMIIEEKTKKEEKITQSLSIENFPALSTICNDNNNNNNTATGINNNSFLEKLNTTNDDNINKNDLEDTKPGWVSITKDSLTNKLKVKYNPSKYYSLLKKDAEDAEDAESVAYNVLYSLCNQYEKRTSEYIEMYGYDTWDKIFRFQNYDYDWVDKLDEEYESEMEKLYYEKQDYDDCMSDQDDEYYYY